MSYFAQEMMTGDVSVQFKIDDATTKDKADPINLELRQHPGSSGPHGFDHCGRHIALGRRIHNEDLHAPAGPWWK